MKQVKKRQECEELPIVYVDSFDDLLCKHKYIGFQTKEGDRYVVVKGGSAKGYAVNSVNTWSTKENQKNYPLDQYRVFDTAKELYEWLANGCE